MPELEPAELRERIRAALARHRRLSLPPGPVPAAVLVPIFPKNGEPYLLFTKRTEQLSHHRGEISFPGGVSQPNDADRTATALRETWEEVGIAPGDVDVLGTLDDVSSIHNYLVTPVVGFFPGSYPLRLNRDEIDRIIQVPLAHLLRPEIFRVEDWRWQGRQHPVYFYTYQGDEIWGMTATILKCLLDIVFPGE
jgi:8-oxo-dGTP pyrophosphatase MutT (NUDIX family)